MLPSPLHAVEHAPITIACGGICSHHHFVRWDMLLLPLRAVGYALITIECGGICSHHHCVRWDMLSSPLGVVRYAPISIACGGVCRRGVASSALRSVVLPKKTLCFYQYAAVYIGKAVSYHLFVRRRFQGIH